MNSRRADAIREALEELRKKNGGKISKHMVVKEAMKNRKGVLGREFNWNPTQAAMAHWLDRAQELIVRYVTVTVINKSKKITSVYYVRDPSLRHNEPGYTALTSEHLDRQAAQQIVLSELDRCEYSIERARKIAGVLDKSFPGLSRMLEDMLEQLIAVRTALAA